MIAAILRTQVHRSEPALPTIRNLSRGRSNTRASTPSRKAGRWPMSTSSSMTGISGAEFSNRPGFLRLMNALKPRAPFQRAHHVGVVAARSRAARDGYAVKQLSSGGRASLLLPGGSERILLDSPTDKFLMSAVTFAAEIEREKGATAHRRRHAAQGESRATSPAGVCFGYRNVEIVGADGKRSHVEREIEPAEADVIRQIFQLSADGYGMKAIAKRLNEAGAPSPRAQQGRSQSWAPSSVRAVLFRPLYRGEIVWNQTRKRDTWGHMHQTGRPEPTGFVSRRQQLRIVADDAVGAGACPA